MRKVGLLCVAIVTISCTPLPPVPFLEDADLAPPVVLEVGLPDPGRLRIVLDEPVELVTGPIPSHGLSLEGSELEGDSLVVRFVEPPSPETEHHVEAQVRDLSGNHLRFVVRFYGLNPNLPSMLINEFTTQGSGNHPDLVEIVSLTAGNIAGACVFEGTPENWEQRFVLPSVNVSAGDYIVVHFKPEGIPEEVDETRSRSASGGRDASPTAWDFWVPEGSGLSGNNGVVSLCRNALGGYVDAVLYSNRTSDSDEHYRGFGSRDVVERADALAAAGAWVSRAGQRCVLAPEDAIDPEPSTATRSMSRDSDSTDSNTANDWHL
ncbi:MAG: hypothetical protein ACOC1I_09045, partial [Spirochaetota bacterium]